MPAFRARFLRRIDGRGWEWGLQNRGYHLTHGDEVPEQHPPSSGLVSIVTCVTATLAKGLGRCRQGPSVPLWGKHRPSQEGPQCVPRGLGDRPGLWVPPALQSHPAGQACNLEVHPLQVRLREGCRTALRCMCAAGGQEPRVDSASDDPLRAVREHAFTERREYASPGLALFTPS